jgi:membrane protease YdiL (CAAX protease family)
VPSVLRCAWYACGVRTARSRDLSSSPERPSIWPDGRRGALLLGGGIALYGNSFAVVDGLTRLPLGGTFGGALLGLGAVALAARGGRAELHGLGIHRRGLVRSLLAGLLLGLVLGLPGALYLLRPDLMPLPVQVGAVAHLTPALFFALIFGKILFCTALAEELAFRGLLQSRLREAFGPRQAVLIGALVFTAWHWVVSFTTLQDTTLAADFGTAGLAYLFQNLAVLVGGLLFGLLRERTGNLAGCVLAHWLVDTLLLTGLYLA